MCRPGHLLKRHGPHPPSGCPCLAHLRSGKLKHKSKHRPPFMLCMQYGCVAFKICHFYLRRDLLA